MYDNKIIKTTSYKKCRSYSYLIAHYHMYRASLLDIDKLDISRIPCGNILYFENKNTIETWLHKSKESTIKFTL